MNTRDVSVSIAFHRLIYRWQRSSQIKEHQIRGTKIDMKFCVAAIGPRHWQLDRIRPTMEIRTQETHIYSPDTVRWTVLINGGWALTWHSYTPPSRSVAELKSNRQSFGFSKASENLESLAYVSRPIVSKCSSSPRLRTQDTWNKRKMWLLYWFDEIWNRGWSLDFRNCPNLERRKKFLEREIFCLLFALSIYHLSNSNLPPFRSQ